MTATIERDKKQIPPHERDDNAAEASRNSLERVAAASDGRWARACAFSGAAVWAALAVLARIGIARFGAIELLFLFAPLVIVPLGMELGRAISGVSLPAKIARRLQPLGALLAVLAMWLPIERWAGVVAAGWLVVCAAAATDGLITVGDLWKKRAGESPAPTQFVQAPARWLRTDVLIALAIAIARIDLAVGGAWLVASRLGWRPLGIQEPIGLLTAVHFHFAGFATATIAAATLRFAERFDGEQRWLRRVIALLLGLPFLVAAGFVISPALRMSAAILFSASVAAFAVLLRGSARKVHDPAARMLLQVAAGAVFAAMLFSAAYAVVNFAGSDVITVPQMASTHGLLNAMGFCLCGLLGWLVKEAN